MTAPKKYVLQNVLGGKFHRKKLPAVPHGVPFIEFATFEPTSFMFDSGAVIDHPNRHIYVRRVAMLGEGKELTYYADAKLSSSEAFDRLTTYMLSRSGAKVVK